MKLLPLGDKVVLKQKSAEVTTKSGLVLTSKSQEKPQEAEIIAVGPGTPDEEMQVKVGEVVIYHKFAGVEVEDGDDTYIIVRQQDILAIVEE